jgi:hypothetical protein
MNMKYLKEFLIGQLKLTIMDDMRGAKKISILGEAIRLEMGLYFFLSSSCLQWAVIKSQDQKSFQYFR